MHYPRAPSSPAPTTTHHHTQEQDMHHSSSSPTALSTARPERHRDPKAGHQADNGVPSMYDLIVIESAITAARGVGDDWHAGYAAGLSAALRILGLREEE